MNIVYLKPGREKSLLRRHPWIFSGAIAKTEVIKEIGETVEIRDSRGHFLGWGAYSPESQIRVRVWSWSLEETVGPELFYSRLKKAVEYRRNMYDSKGSSKNLPSAVRLVYAESDELPGLIVDQYDNTLVVQFLSAGADRHRETFVDLLFTLTQAEYVYERSDADVRKLEGLAARAGVLRGSPPEQLSITENNMQFIVDLAAGHKTGFYLDQRENRQRVRNLVGGKEVLDCFAYTGGFTVNALAGGATSVTAIDTSQDALELARKNIKLNSLPDENVEWIQANVFQQLRKFRDQARKFDLIILDPPKFAPTSSQVKKAARGYKDINLLALKLLRPGGFLVTFSCSGGVSADLFQKIVAGAALDAGVSAHIVRHLEQSPDHPVALNFPESAYLKGLILRVGESSSSKL
jgi:23S rRNA (cytosine1962-C5)-methyltransferase